ncbi:MAG: Glycosyl transferase family 2 [Microgenomates group bacterium GW2011_GWC1_41_20]|uniref:Glycosyl transferase family 2 n=1 Tax=Candidatus Woesebacteria bacterium GW2011_GWD1_41_12 TaxID=1618593 RepID=A0A0G0UPU3_9BACT|nr:MAG: Glycosyl transferase family 2 [Candidatus Woesebacteria bacterium GW2011_GWD1_41_12]KKS00482.1 MAG: Glycosyl transferase family 2 [Microgenomates group bacterium GW2011_GWC1_41_20]
MMPAWNEVENIKSMVEVLTQDEFPKIGADMQLLIVDNHSTDGTAEAAEDASKKYNNVHIIQQKNSGLGWAYVSGMQYAIDELKADAILEMDADFQHPPRFVKPMVEAYLSGAEYVIGSRYIEGGSVPKEWAASRKAISFFGNLFIRTVLLNFKIHDLTTGFRLSKVRGVLDKIELVKLRDLDKFAYKVDLLYQSLKNSKKTVEVPLEFASRTKDKSKFNWKEMVATFKLAIILGIKDKQRFIKFGVVGFTGFLVNYLGLEFLKRMGLTTYWATLFATEMSIISNFILNNIWTFKDKTITSVKDVIMQFAKFNLSSLFAVIVQPLVVNGATTLFGDTSLIRLAGLLFALFLVVVPYNYIVYNLFIWRTWKIPKFFKRD